MKQLSQDSPPWTEIWIQDCQNKKYYWLVTFSDSVSAYVWHLPISKDSKSCSNGFYSVQGEGLSNMWKHLKNIWPVSGPWTLHYTLNTQTERITYLEAITFMISRYFHITISHCQMDLKYLIYDIRSISNWWQLWAANEKNWAGSQKGLYAGRRQVSICSVARSRCTASPKSLLAFVEAVFS